MTLCDLGTPEAPSMSPLSGVGQACLRLVAATVKTPRVLRGVTLPTSGAREEESGGRRCDGKVGKEESPAPGPCDSRPKMTVIRCSELDHRSPHGADCMHRG